MREIGLTDKLNLTTIRLVLPREIQYGQEHGFQLG